MSKIPVNQTSPEHRNYLLAKSYLEYIQWQLADLDSFSSFAPIAERAAKFNQLQARLKIMSINLFITDSCLFCYKI